ncbi:MAG: reprolysin-like metallopeptidase, partial [Bacteroidota bacterium]
MTYAQESSFWKDAAFRNPTLPAQAERRIQPQQFRLLDLNMEALQRQLSDAPTEAEHRNGAAAGTLTIPLPEGESITMKMLETQTMQSGLALRYPMIKTYKGIAADGIVGWFDYGRQGFHGAIYLPKGTVYIDPYASRQDRFHMAYYTKDQVLDEVALASYRCELEAEAEPALPTDEAVVNAPDRDPTVDLYRDPAEKITMRQYRLAMAATGEYSAYHSTGSNVNKEDALSAMVTAVNRVNSVLEREIAVQLLLVEENDKVIFLDRFSDPYTNGNTGAMIDENPAVLDTAFTRLGYDIGHVLGTNAGGLAQLQSVCGGGKARGVTCHSNPIGDNFYIDYICHEVGHQFGAGHTFNNCGGNESSGTAYEPGSGSTIMSYSGLCGENNIQFSSGDYYHVASLEQMIRFSRQNNGNNCGAKVTTNNNTPEVTLPYEKDFYIPIGTPFELVGEATDSEGDAMRYNWEQYDLGPIGRPLGTAELNSPLFRSVNPGEAKNRVFPNLDQILSNNPDKREVLPDYSRNMTFRFIARDFNPEGGGVDWETLSFKATDTAGPFEVDYPSESNTTLEVGQFVEIKWDVANTTNGLVNCQNVNILLSTDGGRTFPIEWAMNTPNDGAEFVLVPDMTTPFARVKIEAADNIFFDISNTDFTIATPSQPGYSLGISSNYEQVCLPASAKINLITSSLLAYDSLVSLSVVSDLPEGANITFTKNPIVPGEQTEMTIDMENVTGNQVFDVVLQAVAPNTDTAYRSITLDVVSNDFSSFQMLGPDDGSSGLSGLPMFNWNSAADANTYNIEIATSPAFDAESIVDQRSGVVDTFYQPGVTLEENTLYYWRVQPANRCGGAPFEMPSAIQM